MYFVECFVKTVLQMKRLRDAAQASVDLAEAKAVHQTKQVLKAVAFLILITRAKKPKTFDAYFQSESFWNTS